MIDRSRPSRIAGVVALIGVVLFRADPAAAQESADRWLGPDKPVHLLAAYLTAGSGYAAALELDAGAAERRQAAVAAGLVAGIAKEAFDAFVQEERWSWKDLTADAAGVALLVALTLAAEP